VGEREAQAGAEPGVARRVRVHVDARLLDGARDVCRDGFITSRVVVGGQMVRGIKQFRSS
jgi:hypothetical protein